MLGGVVRQLAGLEAAPDRAIPAVLNGVVRPRRTVSREDAGEIIETYRPGRSFAIVAHLLPRRSWASMMMRSSSAVHCSLRTAGLSWLCQRSRHCLPMRPLRCDEMNDQLCGPCLMGCQWRGRSVGESRAVMAREDQRRTYACTSLMMSSSSLQGLASVGVDIGDGAYCKNERRTAAA